MNVAAHMASGKPADPGAFILENTRVLSPPLVPEVRLHLAEESFPLWRMTEVELGALNVPPPYWAFAWAGGQALARYVLDHPETVAGKRVIDLGSGSGLGAIASVKAGARSAIASEIDRFALRAIELNAELNNVALEISNSDWLNGAFPEGDLILLGDVFYEAELADKVMAMIAQAERRGVRALIGDPKRSYFPRDKFVELARYAVPVTRELEDAEIKAAAVWAIKETVS